MIRVEMEESEGEQEEVLDPIHSTLALPASPPTATHAVYEKARTHTARTVPAILQPPQL